MQTPPQTKLDRIEALIDKNAIAIDKLTQRDRDRPLQQSNCEIDGLAIFMTAAILSVSPP